VRKKRGKCFISHSSHVQYEIRRPGSGGRVSDAGARGRNESTYLAWGIEERDGRIVGGKGEERLSRKELR